MYDNNHKIIQQFNVENNIRDIFCGDNIIVLKTFDDKIIIISEFGINEIKYYNKNGFRIDNLTVRYNEIFILLSNSKEQMLLRYTPINEYRYLKISFEFYERLYKINLKKKIKLIYSTSTHYSNGIFFEIDCDEKEKNIYELKSDKIFTLINRNFKIKKATFEKIKDLTEEQIAIMSNMGKNSNNWKNGRNNNMKDLDLINNLKNRNTSLSLEHFFNNSSISDENMINLTGRTFKYNKDNESEEEKRRKRLQKMKEMREKIKKTAKDEYDRLMKEKYDKIRKKEEEEKLRRKKEEDEKLRRQKEEEEKLRRKKEEEEKLRRKKEEEEKLRRQKEEEEKLRKLKEEEEKLRKLKEEEEKLRKLKEEEEKLRRQKEEEERKKQEELERKKEEEKLKLRSKTSEKNKNKTSKKDKNNFNKKSQNLKSKQKEYKVEEQLMFNGRRVIKLKNKEELIEILNNPNDETIYYYIEDNKENMDDLLSKNDYFPFNGKNLIKVKGGKIIKNYKNRINRPKIIKVEKPNKKKKENSNILNKYFNNNHNSLSYRNFSTDINLEKGSDLKNKTRAYAEIIPKQRNSTKKLKMRLISEIKNLEKENIDLNINNLNSSRNKRKSAFFNENNSLKDIHLKNKNAKKRISMPTLRGFNTKNEEESKISNIMIESTRSKFGNDKFANNEIDLTKTVNTKILQPYELDE